MIFEVVWVKSLNSFCVKKREHIFKKWRFCGRPQGQLKSDDLAVGQPYQFDTSKGAHIYVKLEKQRLKNKKMKEVSPFKRIMWLLCMIISLIFISYLYFEYVINRKTPSWVIVGSLIPMVVFISIHIRYMYKNLKILLKL